ncbi:MAG TPA: molecular chaperone DnaJ [Clostridiales bacterium]|nr:molecular chaperone DnaJ [Clostridiales bacterium]
MAEKKNYYDILGVSKTASQDEIKSAYRKLARQYHPDLHPNDEACAKKFKEINEANEILSDPEKRKKYDFELDHPEQAGVGGFSGSAGEGGFSGFSGFGDIFGDIFGNDFSQGRAQSSHETKTKGEDITVEIELSFLDAVKGVKKTITFNRREPCASCKGTGAKDGTSYTVCTSCNGTGQKEYRTSAGFFTTVRVGACKDCGGTGKKITVKCPDCAGKGYIRKSCTVTLDIPGGADTGSYIKKRGMGNASINGGECGDLIVIIKVLPHKIFKRKNFDLYVDLPISYMTAVLGGKIMVPGIDKLEELEIPKGTQNGKMLTLRGKGINSKLGTGSIYYIISVEIPTKISAEQERLLRLYGLESDIKQCPKMKEFSDNVNKLYGDNPYKDVKF